ncbi:hypothetical protein AJ80_04007 [Polytolypa hystricis UAMH7299]|uniref:Uncharacterized protein n=1 Tax=Polytolypa hystricis (strain UAMH7299) TaxID=1447883 RepID=A0A2B7YFJ4_POLH7|nr:hypothetical protein AJ80_04007 [Polytolypa hystricis UAMH7299]
MPERFEASRIPEKQIRAHEIVSRVPRCAQHVPEQMKNIKLDNAGKILEVKNSSSTETGEEKKAHWPGPISGHATSELTDCIKRLAEEAHWHGNPHPSSKSRFTVAQDIVIVKRGLVIFWA